MIIQTYKLNKKRERIGIKEIDLSKFEKIGNTGSGFALKYKKGKSVFVYDENIFEWYERMQEDNDRAVKNKSFHYKKINENELPYKQNRARDEKGRPIRVYEEPVDCFIYVKNKSFIDELTFSRIWKYASDRNILCNWHDGRYVDENFEPIR